MSGAAMFMATELLRASVDDQTTTRTAAHELESFCWAFAFALYHRAVRDVPVSPGRSALDREYRRIFAAHTCQELLDNRAVVLPSDVYKIFDSIQELKAYLKGIDEKRLVNCLYSCWYFLKGFQPMTHDRCLLGADFPGFMDTVKNHPSTPYTAVKATHKGLLHIFAARVADSESEVRRE